jgi:hypothetical protein
MVRDVYPGSHVRIFFYPGDPGVKKALDPGSGSTSLIISISLRCNYSLRAEIVAFALLKKVIKHYK